MSIEFPPTLENTPEFTNEGGKEAYDLIITDLESRLNKAIDSDLIDIKIIGELKSGQSSHFTLEFECSKSDFLTRLRDEIETKTASLANDHIKTLNRAIEIYAEDQKDVDSELKNAKIGGGFKYLIG